MGDRDLAVAAVLRGHLMDGPACGELDERLAELIAAGRRGAEVSSPLEEIFERPALRDWVAAVRGDAHLRPPEVVAVARGDRGLAPDLQLPGPPGAVAAARFVCPAGDDLTWFRQQAGDPVPMCGTHHVALVPAPGGAA